jgi:hypothetical protein
VKVLDMTIAWTGMLKIRDKGGKEVKITSSPRDGNNKHQTVDHRFSVKNQELRETYGVIKLVSDPPHWSVDGK